MSDESTTAATIHVLVAVHEEHRAQLVSTFLRNRGHRVAHVRDGRAALLALRDEAFDVAVLEIGVHETDSLELVHQFRSDPDAPELIVITGNESGETAIGALRLGAYAHLLKPYRMAEIDVLVRRAWEKRQLARENRYLHDRLSRVEGEPVLITRSPPLQAILALVERVAASATSILITGEPGTGRRLLARHIHRVSERRGPFVQGDTADSGDFGVELFGGARTDSSATPRTVGLLELAGHGTLFLPEIGSLPLKLQPRLARALEQGSFARVGRTQRIGMLARLIASTSDDLDTAVREERFDGRLLHHVRTITIAMPPLRERKTDILALAQHFLRTLRRGAALELSPEAVARLESYAWPGNVSELRNVMERVVFTSSADARVIGPDDLAVPDRREARTVVGAEVTVEELERQHIRAILERTGWHQGRAASMLGVSASTLYRKMRELRLEKPAKQRSRGAPPSPRSSNR